MRNGVLSLVIFSFTILLVCIHHQAEAQSKKGAIEAIQPADLKRDLFALADDHFRGRATGTLDELKASMWLAEEARKAGLEPAGDDGTFFQFFSLMRQRVSSHSTVQIGDRVFTLWKDVTVFEPTFAKVDAPIVFVTDPDAVTEEAVKDKVVALQFTAKGLTDPRKTIAWRYPSLVVRNWASKLAGKGVKGIIWVGDDLSEQAWPRFMQYQNRGTFRPEGFPPRQILKDIPMIWVRKEALDLVRMPNRQ